jgi:hypothetical protein
MNAATKKPKTTQARRLVELALDLYDVVVDQGGQAFAVPKAPPRIAVPLQGRGALTKRLTRDYFELHDQAPSATALTQATAILESQASDDERVNIHLRTARTGRGGLVIDLGDAKGRAVEIADGTWTLSAEPPDGVIFRRTVLTAAMPTPRRGGRLDRLREVINVTDEGWDLVRAWLVLAWLPHIPVPILTVTGHQGTGKSLLARTLVAIVDPSPAPLRTPPRGRDLGDWHTVVGGSRVVALDNLSTINPEFSDALCRAVTGDGDARRQLYTDADLIVQTFRRALILTSIDPGALKGDLGERLMPVELAGLDGRRRGESDLDAMLEQHRSAILGGLLDLTAQALAEPVTLPSPPRMADAANVIAAVDRVMKSRALDAYTAGQRTVVATVLESDPLAALIVGLLDSTDGAEWSGKPTRLYRALTSRAGYDTKNLPANARTMSERLKRLSPALHEAERIEVEWRKRDNERVIRLRRLPRRRRITRTAVMRRG